MVNQKTCVALIARSTEFFCSHHLSVVSRGRARARGAPERPYARVAARLGSAATATGWGGSEGEMDASNAAPPR